MINFLSGPFRAYFQGYFHAVRFREGKCSWFFWGDFRSQNHGFLFEGDCRRWDDVTGDRFHQKCGELPLFHTPKDTEKTSLDTHPEFTLCLSKSSQLIGFLPIKGIDVLQHFLQKGKYHVYPEYIASPGFRTWWVFMCFFFSTQTGALHIRTSPQIKSQVEAKPVILCVYILLNTIYIFTYETLISAYNGYMYKPQNWGVLRGSML